ncbi:hypothetical protein [Sphingobium aromaticiconvertens]|uniref:hypothetical protein n=1 Tax=Sphingobium aromaticiconvertens TaxID=365341 RepID=UPI003015FD5C
MDDPLYLKRRLASANAMAARATSRCARIAYRDIAHRYEALMIRDGPATLMVPLTGRQRATQVLPVRVARF